MTPFSKYLKDNITTPLAEYLTSDSHEPVVVDVIIDSIILDEQAYSQLDDKTGFIVEAKTCFDAIPGTKYSCRIDKVFGEQKPGNMRHAHIFKKGDEVFAINADGTAHDGFHQIRIPAEVIPYLKQKGITIPKDNIIECITLPANRNLLLESNNNTAPKNADAEILSIALQVGQIIRKARTFQLVVSNADETLLRLHPKVSFNNLTKLNVSSIPTDELLPLLTHTMDDYSHFNSEHVEIFDHTSTPKSIYVNWE